MNNKFWINLIIIIFLTKDKLVYRVTSLIKITARFDLKEKKVISYLHPAICYIYNFQYLQSLYHNGSES